jgi:hypothetical protein
MSMTPRTWFALVLRYFGAASIISAISYLVTAYDVQKGLYSGNLTVLGEINHVVVDTIVGLVLLFFADRISAFFVPAQRGAPRNTGGAEASQTPAE